MAKKATIKKAPIKTVEEKRHGWNSEDEVGVFLASLIRLTKAKVILEVGVFEGYTSAHMINALPKGSMYVGVDIKDYVKPENKKAFIEEGKKGKVVELVIADSLKHLPTLEKNHFDIVFLDGSHEHSQVLKEFKLAETLITRNGIIAFHDSIHLDDVKRVVEYAGSFNYKYVNLDTPEGKGLALVMR